MQKYVAFNFIIVLVLYIESNAKNTDKIYKKLKKNQDGMEGKIVGGKPIPLKDVPYSAQIFNHGSMCAGTILNSWTLITAAHCFDANKDVLEMVVQIGSRFVYDFNANQYDIIEIIVHPKYNRTGLFASDIALIFVDRPIEFSQDVKKTILVDNKNWMNTKERNFTVIGWGWTQYGGPVSKKGLMRAKLRFVPNNECAKLHKMKMTPDMFCLYGDGSRDTCKGDSGGGVFWKEMMVGITSHGDGCAKKRKPSVYANVYYFKDWIKKTTLNFMNENCHPISEEHNDYE